MKLSDLDTEDKYLLLTLVDVGTNVASLQLQTKIAMKSNMISPEEYANAMRQIDASLSIVALVGQEFQQENSGSANDANAG